MSNRTSLIYDPGRKTLISSCRDRRSLVPSSSTSWYARYNLLNEANTVQVPYTACFVYSWAPPGELRPHINRDLLLRAASSVRINSHVLQQRLLAEPVDYADALAPIVCCLFKYVPSEFLILLKRDFVSLNKLSVVPGVAGFAMLFPSPMFCRHMALRACWGDPTSLCLLLRSF